MSGLKARWRAVPVRAKMGVLIALLALVGLTWQHYGGSTSPGPASRPAAATPAVSPDVGDTHDHGGDIADDDGHARGEYQLPDSGGAPPQGPVAPQAVDLSVGAAKATAERFAGNFASPGGDREGWLARISPDVVPDLQSQYRMTDIRNVPQAAVIVVDGPLDQTPTGMTFEVGYNDGTRIAVGVEMADTGWKVCTVVPAAVAAPSAAPGVVADPGGR